MSGEVTTDRLLAAKKAVEDMGFEPSGGFIALKDDDPLGDYLIDFIEADSRAPLSLNAQSVDCVMVSGDENIGGTEIHLKSGLSVIVCGTQQEVAAMINLSVVMNRAKRPRR